MPPERSTRSTIDARVDAEARRVNWAALEQLVHADPSSRGLAGYRHQGLALDAGQLRQAAVDIARRATSVGIVTGFCALGAERVTAETDGPPGALFLARALAAAGIEARLISDRVCLPILRAGCRFWNLDCEMLVEVPFDGASASQRTLDAWLENFLGGNSAARLSHLIAIERPGPSHTLDSIAAQPGNGPGARERFASEVAQADRDICHNMRGESVEPWTAPVHRLFEFIERKQLPIRTIGIGDGGNELGMGRFAWETLVAAIRSATAARIVCRIATDFALLGGVSDWPAYALALAVARLRGIDDFARSWSAPGQRELVAHLVQAGAVDGVTLRAEATVDALSLDTYLEPLVDMRRLLALE